MAFSFFLFPLLCIDIIHYTPCTHTHCQVVFCLQSWNKLLEDFFFLNNNNISSFLALKYSIDGKAMYLAHIYLHQIDTSYTLKSRSHQHSVYLYCHEVVYIHSTCLHLIGFTLRVFWSTYTCCNLYPPSLLHGERDWGIYRNGCLRGVKSRGVSDKQ